VAGVLFGGAALVPRAINEILFPIGCSFVLWAARALVPAASIPTSKP
jgi:hypothetical protein